jgi:glycosyltransferase involved in cell wall biosynthesis
MSEFLISTFTLKHLTDTPHRTTTDMRKTRILVVSGFSAFFKQGGGEVEAASLRHALQHQGFDADLYGPDIFELDSYDLVIFFSCHSSGLELLETCKELGVKFLLWPNFWLGAEKTPSSAEVGLINKFCSDSDAIVFKSETEKQLFQRFFDFNDEKFLMVDWFVDDDFGVGADQDKFKTLYGLDRYILSVGLIEPVKNQLLLAEAAVEANVNLVLIGGFRKKDYFEACLNAGKELLTFIPHLPAQSPVISSAYAGCDAYVEVSFDPPGRSSIEAALFAKPLMLSSSSWVDELFPSMVNTIKPNDKVALVSALGHISELQKISVTQAKALKKKHSPQHALAKLFDYAHALRAGW